MSIATPRADLGERFSFHRALVILAVLTSVAIVLAIAIYGFDYYWLPLAERPFSLKHSALKPSGRIGISLGIFGFCLFLLIFLYALRKKIPWLARCGSAKHWLDFHVIAGSLAPVIIMFHASFKFQGIAGMAFWLMVAVALSGIIGRYVYAQIPRSLNSVELSLKQMEEMQSSLALESTPLLRSSDISPLLRIPSADEVRKMSAASAILTMVWLDLLRPLHVARLRARALRGAARARSLWGLLSSGNPALEAAIRNARRRSALAKRIAFLGKTHQVFHLWHVVHRPFSYSFAVLAVVHLVVVIALGYL